MTISGNYQMWNSCEFAALGEDEYLKNNYEYGFENNFIMMQFSQIIKDRVLPLNVRKKYLVDYIGGYVKKYSSLHKEVYYDALSHVKIRNNYPF